MTLLLTFETVSAALACEGLLKQSGRPCRVIPVPRSLSASCAYAISLETGSAGDMPCGMPDGFAGDPREFGRGLRAEGADFVKVFCCTETGGRETYTELPLSASPAD
jgi:hypothetical protein